MIVIKYGGHALPKPGTSDPVLKAIADLHLAGQKVVLVHGGGPQIDEELRFHQIESRMVSGYRYTTSEIFEVVQRTLSGQVLRTLVNQLISAGVNAVGLSTADGSIIRAKQMHPLVDGTLVDIGMVGDIDNVDVSLLTYLLERNYFPVLSPVGVDSHGNGLNINADIAAGAIGGALKADEVLFMTDVPGIYRDFPDPNSLIHQIPANELREISSSFHSGMIPKVKAALNALDSGANRVRVIDGRSVDNLLSAFRGVGGTVVVP